ncbi:hypothetical protein KY289_036893 [Solanum tuberosum]|nr:hypothetical protein KY284_037761 [Solanum tuberosum]KAH0636978.1 hypothetical protein KY289_036893 [Solanum tuberosum]
MLTPSNWTCGRREGEIGVGRERELDWRVERVDGLGVVDWGRPCCMLGTTEPLARLGEGLPVFFPNLSLARPSLMKMVSPLLSLSGPVGVLARDSQFRFLLMGRLGLKALIGSKNAGVVSVAVDDSALGNVSILTSLVASDEVQGVPSVWNPVTGCKRADCLLSMSCLGRYPWRSTPSPDLLGWVAGLAPLVASVPKTDALRYPAVALLAPSFSLCSSFSADCQPVQLTSEDSCHPAQHVKAVVRPNSLAPRPPKVGNLRHCQHLAISERLPLLKTCEQVSITLLPGQDMKRATIWHQISGGVERAAVRSGKRIGFTLTSVEASLWSKTFHTNLCDPLAGGPRRGA